MADTASRVRELVGWFRARGRDLPWRRTADPYAIWVSEIMLQQTQVATVIPYYRRWMAALPSVAALAAAAEETVLGLWAGLGYYSRARNLRAAARWIMAERGGRFPRDYASVLSLTGVGRYTAGAICSLAYNLPTPVLDGNVARVLARVLGIRRTTHEPGVRRRLWSVAGEWVEAAARLRGGPACGELNEGMMELGATVCTPRKPSCTGCPLRAGCAAFRLGLTTRIPTPRRRPDTVRVRRLAVVLERGCEAFVRRRAAGETNAGLWEFPSVAVAAGAESAGVLAAWSGFAAERFTLVTRFRHSITRYRIELEAYRARADRAPAGWAGEWQPRSRLAGLAFSGAHRRIATAVGVGRSRYTQRQK
jgi:A/G-specific adenine glycosylase